MGKYGTNLEGFGAYEGGVNADKGAPLVSTSSDGETALLFGPAALREIQAGVANGDFAIPPDAAGDTITEENPLPYWTFTDVNSAGAITCAIVADATAGSGNVLRWSVAASTTTGKSATLARYVPVAASRNRAFAHIPELNTASATNTANASVTITYQYYKQDYTTTGSSASSTATFSVLGTGTNWLAPAGTTTTATPSDAAFIYVQIKVSTTGTTPSSVSTVDITEARVIRGDQTTIFAEYRTPGTYAPTFIRQDGGELQISPNGGTGNTELGGSLTVVGGTIDTSGDMTVASGNGDLIIKDTSAGGAPRLQFMTSDGTYRGGIRLGSTQNFAFVTGNTTDDYGFVLAERFYPMNGTAGSRYIYDDGTYTRFTGPILSDGVLQGDALRATAIPTTTNTTNAAIWVLNAGTDYTLRRNTSSARYKTNIVDADAAVLEAARKIKPRHYESTIADEAGTTRLGFIAEEVLEAGLSHAVGYDAEGRGRDH
jgi:hypothetical protein